MAFTYRPCTQTTASGAACARPTWRTNPQFCKRCYRVASRNGALPGQNGQPLPRGARRPRATGARATGARRVLFAAQPTGRDLMIQAMAGFETAMMALAAERPGGPTAEQEASFVRYQRCKALALAPGTQAEGMVALKMAMRTSLDLVF